MPTHRKFVPSSTVRVVALPRLCTSRRLVALSAALLLLGALFLPDIGAAKGTNVELLLMREESRLAIRRTRTTAPTDSKRASPGIQIQTIRVPITKAPPRSLPKTDLLQQVWQLLTDGYLYSEKLNSDEAIYKAVEGLVNSLEDPYTVFLRPSSSQALKSQIQGEVIGIGAQVEQDKNGDMIIVAPLKGSPAEKAGLKAGDLIIEADGVKLSGLSLDDAVTRIRGPKGSQVRLLIRRGTLDMEFTVTRDVVRVPEVVISSQGSAKGNVAVVKIHQFGRITETELRKHLTDIQSRSPRGLVLDLRNNPGGLLSAADVVTSNFLPEGSVVAQIATAKSTTEEVTAEPPTIAMTVPMVVLVNKGSASASEIVAGALQDHGRAKVIGETTFGKGSVQHLSKLSDGSYLKMTIAKWLTPKGRDIDGVGIVPDIEQKEEDGGRDLPMLRALETLGSR